jgi:hypothetical protein
MSEISREAPGMKKSAHTVTDRMKVGRWWQAGRILGRTGEGIAGVGLMVVGGITTAEGIGFTEDTLTFSAITEGISTTHGPQILVSGLAAIALGVLTLANARRN